MSKEQRGTERKGEWIDRVKRRKSRTGRIVTVKRQRDGVMERENRSDN